MIRYLFQYFSSVYFGWILSIIHSNFSGLYVMRRMVSQYKPQYRQFAPGTGSAIFKALLFSGDIVVFPKRYPIQGGPYATG